MLNRHFSSAAPSSGWDAETLFNSEELNLFGHYLILGAAEPKHERVTDLSRLVRILHEYQDEYNDPEEEHANEPGLLSQCY